MRVQGKIIIIIYLAPRTRLTTLYCYSGWWRYDAKREKKNHFKTHSLSEKTSRRGGWGTKQKGTEKNCKKKYSSRAYASGNWVVKSMFGWHLNSSAANDVTRVCCPFGTSGRIYTRKVSIRARSHGGAKDTPWHQVVASPSGFSNGCRQATEIKIENYSRTCSWVVNSYDVNRDGNGQKRINKLDNLI